MSRRRPIRAQADERVAPDRRRLCRDECADPGTELDGTTGGGDDDSGADADKGPVDRDRVPADGAGDGGVAFADRKGADGVISAGRAGGGYGGTISAHASAGSAEVEGLRR